MAEDKGKEEEKFDFTPEGEGYISLAEARVLAVRTAVEAPGNYGRQYRRVAMVFEAVESGEDEDFYTVTLSFRPQRNFAGTPGQEQFVIGKDGTIAVRQVLSLPTQTSASPADTVRKGGGFPVIPVAIGLVVVGIVVVGIVAAVGAVFMGFDEPPRTSSFAAGTPILTSNGYVAIEELQEGDTVLSYDHNFQTRVEANIAAVVSRQVNGLMRVELANGTTIQVTREHPFYSPDEARYKPIGEFKPGERLGRIGRDEKLETIVVTGIKAVRGEFTVYNLSVESSHHNYVAAGVLVHNKILPPPVTSVPLTIPPTNGSYPITPRPTYTSSTPTARVKSATLKASPLAGVFVDKWGTEGSGDGQFNSPGDVAVDSFGSIYVADTGNHRIQKFNSDGVFKYRWGDVGSGDEQFNSPRDVAVAPDGSVYVADASNLIQKFTSNGVFVSKWGTYGKRDGELSSPRGLAVASDGSVYVADAGNDRIQKFTSEGVFVNKWGGVGPGDGQFNSPRDVAVASDGSVYVADAGNHRIQKFTSEGVFVTKWGSPGSGDGQFDRLNGIGLASDGSVYVTDKGNNRIQKFTSEGVFVSKWGTNGAGDGEFRNPRGVAVASDGSVYVADYGNHRIQKFSVGP